MSGEQGKAISTFDSTWGSVSRNITFWQCNNICVENQHCRTKGIATDPSLTVCVYCRQMHFHNCNTLGTTCYTTTTLAPPFVVSAFLSFPLDDVLIGFRFKRITFVLLLYTVWGPLSSGPEQSRQEQCQSEPSVVCLAGQSHTVLCIRLTGAIYWLSTVLSISGSYNKKFYAFLPSSSSGQWTVHLLLLLSSTPLCAVSCWLLSISRARGNRANQR